MPARAFDTVRKLNPGTFPPSCSRQKIRFENQQSGNGGEKSGNYDLMPHDRHTRCHHRQNRARDEIRGNLERESLAPHWKTPGDSILHSAIHRNGVHTTSRSQHPRREPSSGVTVGGNYINALRRQASPAKESGLRELGKGNRSRPRDVYRSKFVL
jgi:hypothetical protein